MPFALRYTCLMSPDQLLALASFLHHKGAQRALLTDAQRGACLAHADGFARECKPHQQAWARVVYSSEPALRRVFAQLAAFRPELLRKATPKRRASKR